MFVFSGVERLVKRSAGLFTSAGFTIDQRLLKPNSERSADLFIRLNRIGVMHAKKRIAVIGAGIIGLSTAYNILDTIPNVEVTVFYDSLSPNTTSDVAAGLWLPHKWGQTPEFKVLEWGQATWARLVSLAHSELAPDAGTFFVSGRLLYRERRGDPPPWKDIVIGFRQLTARELELYGGRYKDGVFFSTVACHSSKYLPWLADEFQKEGGLMRPRKVGSFAELANFDVLVNCTGNGARDLCRDQSVRPIRGHVIRAKAPWIKEFVVAPDDDLHVLCSPDGVVMGMTYREDSAPNLKPADRERILRGCAELVPSVVRATELRDWLGFRPVRDVVRLEVEEVSVAGKAVPVVHNYGHGGSGVSLHWGCAREATALVKEIIHREAKL